ncbi:MULTISPECIES: hypothetical protein [Actinomycetes]|uniref:hypothetical protein n=1 Tax=Actinomycetes TaxID=1760 RepID=UPI0012DBF2F9|nr:MULTISPECIES: hypothetical protein [Actinomycetes]
MTTLNDDLLTPDSPDDLLKKDVLDSFCVTGDAPWSIMTSAESNSSLAAVLAGLLIATIAVMFNWPEERHTIALFASGVVVLALDSYLFSHVKAVQPFTPFPIVSAHQVRIDEACERAWIQAMPASGMLATGGVALMCGLAWMMTTYETQSARTEAFLPTLGGVLAVFVITITDLLLIATTVQYLDVVEQAEGWPLLWFAIVFAAAMVIPSWVFVYRSTRILREAIKSRNEVIDDATNPVEQPQMKLKPTGALKSATVGTGLYALVGPFFAGFYALVNQTGNALFIWGAVVVGLFYPAGVALLMSLSLPRPANSVAPSPRPPRHQPTRVGAITMAVLIAMVTALRRG